MKRLQLIGFIIFTITIAGFILWHFTVSFPDWLVRVNGILMLVSVFIVVFTTIKISVKKM